MPRKEEYSFDDLANDRDSSPFREKKRDGIFISKAAIVIYVLGSILLAALVGLIVHFASPCHKYQCDCSLCPSTTPQTVTTDKSAMTSLSSSTTTAKVTTSSDLDVDEDILWQRCVNLSWSRSQCFEDAFPCEEEQTVPYLLPATFRPVHYKIEIKPDIYGPSPQNFSYEGSVSISLTCTNRSDVIFIHFRSMKINKCTVALTSNGTQISVSSITIDEQREFYKIHLNRQLNPEENITVNLQYSGDLKLDMVGMYYSDYNIGNVTKYLLATQFEATDARKAFPCLDEPALKATFEVTLWRKKHMTALSNMPRINSTDKGEDWVADYFGPTPVIMPTYLIAFAVAEYNYVEAVANNSLTSKHLRHWSRPDFIEQGLLDYSLDVCVKMFDYFETYFDFPYEMPKEDQISIPDFDAGAMENWGLITYRESRMVWDPQHSTLYEKQRTTGTLAHELLHQWLGNVVTCSWWNDLWLQEGMARYHQHLAMKDAQPDWDVDQIYAAQVIYRAMQYDQTGQSHPIHNLVRSPGEIETMFSPITYDKAGCVIRMTKELMLGDSYHEAIKQYVKDNAYGSVSFMDLLSTWDKQALKDNIRLDTNISMVMLTWLLQMGYPLVTINRTGPSTAMLSQSMFLENPKRPYSDVYPSPFGHMWDIPVSFVTRQNQRNMTIEWLNMEAFREVTLPRPLQPSDWLLGNYKQFGFYRVNYDPSNWLALIDQLNTDHQIFDVVNRGQLLDDSYYIARAAQLDHVIHLKLTQYLSKETDYLPWHSAADFSFAYFTKIFRNHPDFIVFRNYVRGLLENHYDRLGWDEKSTDTHHDVYLRDLILTHMCSYGYSDCINKAKHYFETWRENPTNASIIRPDIRDAVYCTAIRNGLVDDWEFFFEQYKQFEHFSLEKSRRRRALTCSDDRPTLTRLFTLAAEYDSSIVSHDPHGPIAIMRDISRTSIGQYVAWEYLNKNWMNASSKFTILAAVSGSFSTDYDLIKYDAFVDNHPPEGQTEKFHFEDMRIIIEHNNRWRHSNEVAMFAWLKDVTGS